MVKQYGKHETIVSYTNLRSIASAACDMHAKENLRGKIQPELYDKDINTGKMLLICHMKCLSDKAQQAWKCAGNVRNMGKERA